jgi:preprotein translocase subunit SecY
VSVPTLIGQFLNQKSLAYTILFKWFGYTSFAYAALYLLLIIGFNYFYVAIQYNPNEIANNLRKNNGGIPGIRPGKPTADFIKHCLNRITLIGALFLGLVAVMPIFLSHFVSGMALGGTTLLIVVGVAIDTSRQLESQMMMRHYKGFLE